MKDKIGNFIKGIKNNKHTSIIIFLIIIISVIIFFISRDSFSKINFWEDKPYENNSTNLNLEQDILISGIEIASKDIKLQNDSEIINGQVYFNKVKIPVISNEQIFDYPIENFGCDEHIVWISTSIDPTPAPLNASIKKLFEIEKGLIFNPGNFLSTQKDLKFIEAKINNGIAEIYLEGQFTIAGVCDEPRKLVQLKEIASQFDSILETKIYLNGELLK